MSEVSLAVDEYLVPDLEDDFMMNETLDLYEFIGKDLVKAFYLGLYMSDWFKGLSKSQRYLYSKQARHNKEGVQKYSEQIEYWTNKFPGEENEEIRMVKLAEFVLSNMFWDEDQEDIDRVKVAFFFGNAISQAVEREDETMEKEQESKQSGDKEFSNIH